MNVLPPLAKIVTRVLMESMVIHALVQSGPKLNLTLPLANVNFF